MITVDDRPMQWHPGMTLSEVLAALPDGHIFAVVRLNGRLISKPAFDATPVEDNAVVEPLPLIAGG